MAIGTGISAQLGWAVESTYGTYVAPTKFAEILTESVKLTANRIEGAGLRSGQRVQRDDRWTSNVKGAGGDIELEFPSTAIGLLLKAAMGASTITTPTNGVLTRKHAYTLGDTTGQSLTVQIGRPDVAGTVQPFSYTGCKFTALELSCDLDAILKLKLTLDAQTETTAQALAAASYPAASEVLYFTGASLSLAGGAFADITKFDFKVDFPLANSRYFLRGAAGAPGTSKKEPLPNGLVVGSGTIDAEFNTLTAYNRFVNGAVCSLTAKFIGSQIEAVTPTYYNELDVVLANVRFDGDTPNLNGADIIGYQLPFKVTDAGAGASAIELDWITKDTAD